MRSLPPVRHDARLARPESGVLCTPQLSYIEVDIQVREDVFGLVQTTWDIYVDLLRQGPDAAA
jgi:hypothetical protein